MANTTDETSAAVALLLASPAELEALAELLSTRNMLSAIQHIRSTTGLPQRTILEELMPILELTSPSQAQLRQSLERLQQARSRPPAVPTPAELHQSILSLLRAGDRQRALVAYRVATGRSRKDAELALDALTRQLDGGSTDA